MNTRTRAPKVLLVTFCLLIQSTVALAQVPNYIPSNGLVGWWPFNGNANDESGNGINGITNGATLTNDKYGNPNKAYSFNGTSNTINFSNAFFGGGQKSQFTIYTKILLHSTSNSPNIWGKTFFWGEVNFSVSNNNEIQLRWANSITGNKYSTIYSDPNVLQLGQWYDIVIVFQNSSAQIYLNGVPISTNLSWVAQGGSTLSTTQIEAFCNFDQDANSSKLGLRYTGGNPGNYLDGVIDDFGIWDRALTPNEINQINQSQSCGYGGQIFRSPSGVVCPSDTVHLFASGPAGGLIVTDKGNNIGGWRYLETDLADLSSAAALGCPLGPNSTTSNNIGSGFTNSLNIDIDCPDPTFAATLCLNYSKNGYSDWFLPSISTMGLMYQNLHLKGVGGFHNYTGPNWVVQNFNRYWSSSQIGQYGWAFDFGNGTNIPVYNQIVGRNELNRVRPIRFVSGSVHYQWSTGDTTPNISVHPLQTTTYYLTVSQNGQICSDSITVVVSNIQNTFNPFVTDTVTICDTNVTLNAGPGYTSYSWSNGSVNQSITASTPGRYRVTVTDSAGCSATDSIFVSTSSLNISLSQAQNVKCYGDSTGTLAVAINGGRAPYSITWSTGATQSQTLASLPAGTYWVEVTDGNGCIRRDTVVLTQPSAPFSGSASATNVLCHGGSSGSITLNIQGGTPPYQFLWSNGAQTPNLINVSAGIYSVVVTDANGCQLFVTAVVTEPTPLASAISVQNVACFGQPTGSATVSVNGGTPGYMYSWDGAALTSSNFTSGLDTGAHYVLIFDANGCSDSIGFIVNGPLTAITTSPVIANALCFGGTGSISLNATGGSGTLQITWNTNPLTVGQNLVNQPAGIYSYTILDLNTGCMQNGSLTISQPAMLTATAAATNVLCHGDSSGQIQLTISGGTGPYAVTWNNPLAQGINPTSLPAGWYLYTVTDSNMCSISDSIQITQPQQPLSLTTGQTSIGCFGDSTGTAWVVPNGGISPYTYAWIGSNVTNDTLNGVPAGAYTVVVTDSNGCTEQVTINVAQPLAPLNSLTSAQPVTCFGDSSGTASVLVIGGTSPYTYLWSDSASSTTSSINQLSSGWYFVTITDNAGCSLVDSVFVSQPTSSLTIQGGTNSANCFNTSTGSAWVNASGGTAPYSYLWSTGSMNDSISMVLAGNYVVQVVDANGCSQSTVLTVSQPTALSAITSKQDILCHGDTSGSLNVSPIGGLPPYRILWSTGDTLFALNNLAAGSYSAVITDSLGCSYPISINLSEPSVPLALIGFSVDATCHGAQDGSIQVLASGGVGGYSFTLNGGTSSSSGIFTGLNSGSYSVFVTDANGCTASQVFVIDEPDSLIYTSIVNDVSCFGSSDGQVKLNITGGTNTYSILWNTGSQGTEVSGLNGGWYVFTVTDGNGCGFVDSVFINEPSGLQLSITATNPECVSSFDGKLLISSSGGTGNYIYSVNGSISSGSEEDLGPGEFIVTVTDDNGCTASQTVVLTESRNPCVEIPNWFSPDGNGQNDTWVIPGFEFGSYQLFVVNVWGQKVYETRSENYIPWDGTFKGEPLPNGDYYYVVSSSDSSEPTFTGYVTILR